MESKLVAAGIEKWLNNQINSESLTEEQVESLQVAAQCIQAVYDLESNLESHVPDLEALVSSGASTSSGKEISEADQQEAERLKNVGNDHLTAGRCPLAVECYTKSIALDPRNAVYYSNRAAAYTKDGQYDAAAKDCQAAIRIDSSYAKAYGRLGAAYAGMKKNSQAIDAYKQALELDPSNSATKLSLESLLRSSASASPTASSSRQANSGSPFAGMNMPSDMGSLLNNPELMNMAQKMMQSGALDNMMKDPNMRSMMKNMMSGASPPEDE